ncbi:MgtC/SapB family protein [Melittangium boletus]|uniref:MgtC family protein n=1 Tax=Melittangium boletus DSM 14713 TaxID=1294270 RepID=A0A250IAD9_9BACT|nr:MgtC/SapB family protein [Melittangium boletus]ATB28829.1 MgtC family protein [Melittangium boletus DSM 14713]
MIVDDATAVTRLLAAFGLGFILGFERELRGQPAGLRTHILVCLGACLFTLCSLFVAQPLTPGTNQEAIADISRIASQIVVGIGFLGGGAILRQDTHIKGLTTAANLWLTASVGLATGLGFALPALATVVLALLSLVGLRFLEPLARRLRHQLGPSDEDDTSTHPPTGPSSPKSE